MMKALTHNIQQEREDQRDRSAQLFMWCIVVSMHQDDGIGASRLLRACNEMDAFEKKYQTAILYGSRKNATDAMRENLKGICDFEVRLPVDRAPRGRREEQLRMASNQGAEIAWLVMAATCHETFGYGKDRLARLKQNSTSFLLLLTGIFVIIVPAALQLHISPLLFGSRAVLKGAVCPRRRFDKFLFRAAPISPPPESRQQGAAFQRLNS